MESKNSSWFLNFVIVGLTLLGVVYVIKMVFKLIFSIPIYLWFWIILTFLVVFYSS
jgi:hypothetical protein